jgi:hypothetical protein
MSKFEELLAIDVNDKKEKRGNLDYLSWTFAWSEFKKVYPKADYEIIKFEKGGHLVPYMYDEIGYMVNTKVDNGEGEVHEMVLPVMDSVNNAMKSEHYKISTKKGDTVVKAATMFDINKAIMRCLVKNIAMFGLGLYIYAGEDLPDKITTTSETSEQKNLSITEQIQSCKTEGELEEIYRTNKKKIIDNDNLLNLVTEQGKKLKGLVA